MLKTDAPQALHDLEELANCGSLMSMLYIGWAYGRGDGLDRDFGQAEAWLRRAVDSGSVLASFHLGILYREGRQFVAASEMFGVGAEHGFASSMYWLGVIYFNGEGVASDRSRAIALWERASALGHVYAKRNVACLMMTGKYGALGFPKGVLLWLSALSDIFRIGLKNRDSYLLR